MGAVRAAPFAVSRDTSMETTHDGRSSNKVNWGPIGEDVYRRTYSRVMPNGENEQWSDTVARVVAGSASSTFVSDDEQRLLSDRILTFRTLPAGRHLWISGTGLPFSRNCFRAPFTTRLADHFEFMADQLLTGGGVGANYSVEYLTLSPIVEPFTLIITCDPDHVDFGAVRSAAGEFWVDAVGERLGPSFTVPDCREGWTQTWGILADAATGLWEPPIVIFDVSEVRPAGALIRTFGGTASGPAPLVQSLVGMARQLASAVGRHLTSVEAMECDHQIASAVVAGGARRSARMSIVHWRDPQVFEFISCKTDHMHHWTTNISVEIDDEFIGLLAVGDVAASAVFDAVTTSMYLNGEPGFYNSSLAAVAERGDVRSTNPCGEIALEMGESCNIGSVNLSVFGPDDDDEVELNFKLLTRFLIRSTLTKPYQPLTAQVEERNRRIGVGFLGFQEWAARHGVRYSDIASDALLARKLVRFRMIIRQEADDYCDELGIARCIKVTAIAPNGTIAQLPGTQPGIHPIFAKYFNRLVRYTTGSAQIDEASSRGFAVEPCLYAQNTMVVSYPVMDNILGRVGAELVEQSDEIPLRAQLDVLAFVTEHFCSGTDGNAVSFTATVYPDRMSLVEMRDTVRAVLPRVKGLTVFPELSRPQSPYQAITRAEYESQSQPELVMIGGSNDGDACAMGACPIR